jgi:transglutaminase-like putative cysteine protease
MRIEIDHTTRYIYDQPARYGVQELRLTPQSFRGQDIVSWRIDAPGTSDAAEFNDGWGNKVHLASQIGEISELEIRVRGVVETKAGDGIVGKLPYDPPPRIFLRDTHLTVADEAIVELASSVAGEKDLIARCHRLMADLGNAMSFDTDATHVHTTAAEALADRRGVCQDFAHVFIAACRAMDLPARYVTGYLFMPESTADHDAHHAWAEAHVPGLGWVGFDPANAICPDLRYVRLASAPDASLAAPLRGLRRGNGAERLRVSVHVSGSAQQ